VRWRLEAVVLGGAEGCLRQLAPPLGRRWLPPLAAGAARNRQAVRARLLGTASRPNPCQSVATGACDGDPAAARAEPRLRRSRAVVLGL